MAMLMSIFGLVACKEAPDETIEYEGTYRLHSVYYMGAEVKIGESGILGSLTKDLATLTLKDDGTMTFQSTVIMLTFTATGTWSQDAEKKTNLTVRLTNEDGDSATVTATCDGETVTINYEGALFTLKK